MIIYSDGPKISQYHGTVLVLQYYGMGLYELLDNLPFLG